MLSPSLTTHAMTALKSSPARLRAFFAAIIALFFVSAINDDARAQFTFASDSAQNYGGAGEPGWTNASDAGAGFGGWGFSGGGVNAGSFLGNPTNNGINNNIMGSEAFGMFSSANNSGYANRSRGFDVGMGIGDVFTFDWGMNWDSGSSGAKGFDIRSGGTTLFTLISSSSATITFTNLVNSSSGTASSSYGTNNMAVTLTRTATGYTFTMTSRNTGSLFTTNIATSSTIDNFNFFIGDQQDNNGNRNMFFDNLSITNSGVFSQGGTVTNANTFSGVGALSIGNNTTLVLSGGGNNNYTGATTISNDSTLVFAGAGTSTFSSVIGGGTGNLVMSNTNGLVVLTNANTYTGNTTVAAGDLLISHAGALGSTGTLAVNATGQLRLSNGITMTRAITLSGDGPGSGALRSVSGDNTWQGAITLGSGARINADTGLLTLSGGITAGANPIYFGGAGNITVSSIIGGSGASLFKDGAGVLTLSSGNTFTGKTTNNAGTISIGEDSALGAIPRPSAVPDQLTFGGGTLATTGTFSLSANRGITLNSGGGIFDVANATILTINGIIAGSGNGITKSGGGVLVLSGANSYTGATTISAGTIRLGADDRISSQSAVSIASEAVFDLNGFSDTIGALTLNGTGLSGTGAIVNNGANGATLTLNAQSALSGNSSVGGSGNFTIAGNNIVSSVSGTGRTLTKVGNNTVTLAAGSSSQDNTDLFVAVSGGTLILGKTSADGFHSAGGFTVNTNGTLQLGGSGGFQIWKGASTTTVNSGGVFDLNGQNQTFTGTGPTISGAGISSGGALVNNSTGGASTLSSALVLAGDSSIGGAGNLTISGIVSQSGGTRALTKVGAGTLTLGNSANTYAGINTINAGALSIGAAGSLGSASGTTAVTLNNGGALRTTAGLTLGTRGITVSSGGGTIDVTTAGLTNTSGLDGTGALVKTGAGTLHLTNTSGNYAGGITVTNGTLQFNTTNRGANISVGNANSPNGSTLMGAGQVGTVAINTNGRISPGNGVGILSVSNTLTFNRGGSYLWEITNGASGAPGTNWDLITVDTTTIGGGGGTLALDTAGTFTVNGVGTGIVNFNPTNNYTNNYFQIVRATNVTGSNSILAFVADANLGTGSWTFATNNSGLFLNYVAPGVSLVFTNAVDANQGSTNLMTNNPANAFATISDSGGVTAVTISNTAPLIFTNGNNSYSGVTTIQQGTLVAGVNSLNAQNGAFGNASTAIVVGSTTTSSNANLLIGNAGVTVQRDIFINAGGTGTRTIGATNSSGVATYSGNITANTNVTLSAANSNATTVFSGAISQSGNLTAAGSGIVVLSGGNTYTGNTVVSSNTRLVAANNTALGAGSGATTVASGGTLAFSNNISEDEALSIAGLGVGNGGALRNISGANTNTGTITLSANATIAADADTSLQLGNIDVTGSNHQLSFVNEGTVILAGNFLNMGTNATFFKNGSGSLVISNTSANTGGGQLQVGAGSVTLAAGTFSTNTLTSPRGLDLGFTAAGGASTNPTSFFVNQGVTMSNTVYVAPGTGARIMGTESTNGTATFTGEIYLDNTLRLTAATNGTAHFQGALANNGNIVKVGGGTVLLSANNAISNVTISNGILAISNGSAIPSTSLVTIESGGTLSVLSTANMPRIAGTGIITVANNQVLTNTISDTATFGGQFQGAGVIRKAGAGSLTLTGGTSNSIGRFEHEEGFLIMATNTGIASVYQVQFESPGTRTIAASGANNFTLSQSNNIFNSFTIGQTSGNTGSLTFSGGTFLGDAGSRRELTVNGTHTFSGPVTGQLGMTKLGSGSLTLSGNNTFQGGVQHDLGTIIVGNNAALGTGVYQVQFDVAGTKTIAASGTGSFTLSQSNNIFNSLTIGEATGNTGSLTFSGGTFLGDTGGPRVLSVNGTQTLSGAITGTNGLTKAGDGTLVLSGSSANTFSGATTINAGVLLLQKTGVNALAGTPTINNGGTLRLGASDQFAGDTTFLTVNSGGTFDLNNFNETLAMQGAGNVTLGTGRLTINPGSTDTNSGVISGLGSVVKTNNGTQVFTGNNTYTGGTLVEQGTLSIGNGGTTGSVASNITNNATVVFNRSNDLTYSNVMSGGGSLQKLGAGTLTLDNNNTFSGTTTVAAGALRYLGNNTGNSATIISNGASLFVGNGGTAGWLAGTISNNGSLFYNRSDNLTQGGLISGSGALTKQGAGTLTLNGANTYTGTTTISTGAVIAANNGALGTGAGATTVESGAALHVSGGTTLTDLITIAGSGTSGDGAIRSLGNGQNTLSGGINLAGNARINVDAPIGSATTLVSLGSGGFGVIPDFTDMDWGQTTTNLTLTSAAFAQYLTGQFSSVQDWSSLSNLGLRLTAASNPDLSFDLALFDSNEALLRTYQGDTTGFTSTPGIDLLSLVSGNGSLSQVQYMEFRWGGVDTNVNVSLIDLVSIPTSGMTISGAINVGSHVLTLGAAAGGSNSVATGLLISGAIRGAGGTFSDTTTSLVLDGAGVVELTGNNSFTGDIRVLNGALRVGSGAPTNALGNNADLFLSPQAEFAVAANVSVGSVSAGLGTSIKLQESSVPSVGSVLTINGAGKTNVVSGNISGFGGLTLAGNAATRLELTGNNSYSGGTVITGGTLVAGSTGENQALGSTPSLSVSGSDSALLLLTSNQVRDNAAVTLSGGTIRRGGNVSEVFGNLTVTTASFLDYGAANNTGTLSFGTYTPSSLLTVQNFLPGNVLTFRSDLSSSINNASLFNLGAQGFTSSWSSGTSTFTITAIPEPSTYLAAAGLLAMFLWPVRRRLIKDAKSIFGLRASGRDRSEAYRGA